MDSYVEVTCTIYEEGSMLESVTNRQYGIGYMDKDIEGIALAGAISVFCRPYDTLAQAIFNKAEWEGFEIEGKPTQYELATEKLIDAAEDLVNAWKKHDIELQQAVNLNKESEK